jgi:hypothetical protein
MVIRGAKIIPAVRAASELLSPASVSFWGLTFWSENPRKLAELEEMFR